MCALLPNPHVLRVVPAAAASRNNKFTQRAQPRPVLPAAGFCLSPSRVIHAATNALVRVAAHAKRSVKLPTELRAGEVR